MEIDKRLPKDLQDIAQDLILLPEPSENERSDDYRRQFLVRLKKYIIAAYEKGWSVAALVERFKTHHKRTVGRNLLTDMVKLWTGDASYETISRLFPAVTSRPPDQQAEALRRALARTDAADQFEHCQHVLRERSAAGSSDGKPEPREVPQPPATPRPPARSGGQKVQGSKQPRGPRRGRN